MSTYEVTVLPAVTKMLKALARGDRTSAKRITARIDALADDPRPPGYEPVKTKPGHFRVRAGDHRILYRIEDDRLIVEVVAVGHRSSVYDD